MRQLLFFSILVFSVAVQAQEVNLDAEPNPGEHISSCKTRNQNMEKATHRLDSLQQSMGDAGKECFEQIRASVEKCSKDPSVDGQDMQDASQISSGLEDNDVGAAEQSGTQRRSDASSITSQFYATAGIHKMKESKYRSRANACRDEAKTIESVCQKSIDDYNAQEKNNEEASGSSGYAAMNTSGENPQKIRAFIQSGAKDAIKAIKTAGYCDLIAGNDEKLSAEQDRRYAQNLSTMPQTDSSDPTYHNPLVPPAPVADQFENGSEKKEVEKTNIAKFTHSAALGEAASFAVNTLGDTGTLSGSVFRAGYNIADGNPTEAAKASASAVVQSAPYAAEYFGWSSARTWLTQSSGAMAGGALSYAMAVPGAYFGSTAPTAMSSLSENGYRPLDLNPGANAPSQVAINLMDPTHSN